MKSILLEKTVAMIPDGACLMIGGFMGVGTGKLITTGCVAKVVTSHMGLNPETRQKMIAGDIEVDYILAH